jgi:hypothetical protein
VIMARSGARRAHQETHAARQPIMRFTQRRRASAGPRSGTPAPASAAARESAARYGVKAHPFGSFKIFHPERIRLTLAAQKPAVAAAAGQAGWLSSALRLSGLRGGWVGVLACRPLSLRGLRGGWVGVLACRPLCLPGFWPGRKRWFCRPPSLPWRRRPAKGADSSAKEPARVPGPVAGAGSRRPMSLPGCPAARRGDRSAGRAVRRTGGRRSPGRPRGPWSGSRSRPRRRRFPCSWCGWPRY